MEPSVWNMDVVSMFLLTILHIVVSFIFVGIVMIVIKKIKRTGIKIYLATLPLMLFLLYIQFTPFFFSDNYLKYYARNHQLKKFGEVEEISVENETISRTGKQFQYNVVFTVTKDREGSTETNVYDSHYIYEWKNGKFYLIH